jgi:hypothetical protein
MGTGVTVLRSTTQRMACHARQCCTNTAPMDAAIHTHRRDPGAIPGRHRASARGSAPAYTVVAAGREVACSRR